MLHATDHARLRQQMVCELDGEVVPRSETVRGYEYAKGEYVVVSDEEIKAAAPHTEKQLEIVEFCKGGEIDPIWYESSYYLLPEAAGRRPYALLQRAMEESGYVAVAKLAMHNRESIALVRAGTVREAEEQDGKPEKGSRRGLILHTLYYHDEIRLAEGFGASSDVAVSEAELRLAEQLIKGLAAPFHPAQFEDHYRKNLEEVIEAKLHGKTPARKEVAPKLAPVTDLMESLKRSLEAMPAKAATPQAGTHARASASEPSAGHKKPPRAAAHGAKSRKKSAS